MAKSPEKYARRGARTSYISTISGMALVLFMLGLVASIVMSTGRLKKNVKEDISIDVLFFNQASEPDMHELEKSLKTYPFVKQVQFITKEEAFESIKDDLGVDDPLSVLGGENPIPYSLKVNLNESYVQKDSVQKVKDYIETEYADIVQEVSYDERMLMEINDNINNLVYVILVLALLLLIVAIAMINNTIRLAVYSKRFIIKTMTLVGARPGFIRRPFMVNAIVQGIIAGMIAVGLMVGSVFLLNKLGFNIVQIFDLVELESFALLFGGIILLGILISWVSTFFALRKYIRIKLDRLY